MTGAPDGAWAPRGDEDGIRDLLAVRRTRLTN